MPKHTSGLLVLLKRFSRYIARKICFVKLVIYEFDNYFQLDSTKPLILCQALIEIYYH